MSEAARVPFTETKAPESAERLHRGALGLGMARSPADSFDFGFAGIVALVGVASPLVLVVAIIAIALLGDALSQFSRAHPSDRRLHHLRRQDVRRHQRGDHRAAGAGPGTSVAIASVLVISGGFLSIMLQYYLNVSIPWIICSFSAALHRPAPCS